MKMERTELETVLIEIINVIKTEDKVMKTFYDGLRRYGVKGGDSRKIIINPKRELPKVNLYLLCLITEELYKASGIKDLDPNIYFNPIEIEQARRYEEEEEPEETLPVTFENVYKINDEEYFMTLDIKTIKRLWDSKILDYDFDVQREARWVKNSQGQMIQQPKTNPKAVRRIAKHLLDGTLFSTVLTFNVYINESEIIYDETKKEATVESKMFIIDGYHRVSGVLQALQKNPEIEFTFQIALKNFNKRTAKGYVGQINEVNPMDKSRLKSLQSEREADTVVKLLQRQSDLRGKVSQGSYPSPERGELVSYGVLSDAIDETFVIKNRKEANDLADYLTDYFDYLIGSFDDVFNENIKENYEKNLLINNNMFVGHIILAKRAMEENLSVRDVVKVLKNIDFSRENPLWKEIGIVDENNVIRDRARKRIKKYFSELELNTNKTNLI